MVQLLREMATSYLKLILGPMGAGKTTELINELNKFAGLSSCFRVLYVNSTLDTRAEVFSTHGKGCRLDPSITTIKVTNLAEVQVGYFDIVGVDEGQFFHDSHVVKDWVRLGKRVVVAGLDGSFDRHKFDLVDLVPDCDEVVKKLAYCKTCLDSGKIVSAPFTGKKSGRLTEIEVGGMDVYIPLCRACHDAILS